MALSKEFCEASELQLTHLEVMVLQLHCEPNYALRLEVVDVLPQLEIQLLVLFSQDRDSTLLNLQTLL